MGTEGRAKIKKMQFAALGALCIHKIKRGEDLIKSICPSLPKTP